MASAACQFPEAGADGRRIGVGPFKRKRPALVGFDGVDAAEVVGGKVGARSVRTALEHEALAVGGKFRLALYEVAFAHAEKRRNPGDFRIGHADDAILDSAALPATATMEVLGFHARLVYQI